MSTCGTVIVSNLLLMWIASKIEQKLTQSTFSQTFAWHTYCQACCITHRPITDCLRDNSCLPFTFQARTDGNRYAPLER
eukprot:816367-Amphidinium_carterae.1